MRERTVFAAIISVIVLSLFGFSLWAVVFKAIPEANNDAAKMILGSLATMAAGVVYFVSLCLGRAGGRLAASPALRCARCAALCFWTLWRPHRAGGVATPAAGRRGGLC